VIDQGSPRSAIFMTKTPRTLAHHLTTRHQPTEPLDTTPPPGHGPARTPSPSPSPRLTRPSNSLWSRPAVAEHAPERPLLRRSVGGRQIDPGAARSLIAGITTHPWTATPPQHHSSLRPLLRAAVRSFTLLPAPTPPCTRLRSRPASSLRCAKLQRLK
jgi:hypothetical protein